MNALLVRTTLALVLGLAGSAGAHADEVLVAVAANFAAPMARLADDFKASTGHTLKLASGATGKFYSQIVAGGPFEVLLSADDETPQRLIREGHAVAGSAFTYAVGQLVLWSATPGLVDAQGAVLASGRFQKLAIANPKTAPYGRAAMEVLAARGLTAVLSPKLVTGESVAQAYQFVATGNAELGFVALSQVSVPGKALVGSMWRVPAALHTPIRQDAVLLKAGAGKPAAAALLQWLRSEPVQAVIRSYGYERG
ncbi:molybdate ABC transporter substrate-binding protein [Sphaerotilus sp.]|uniref:molybdate ABC transporter substrate-binding protein n=1 Tax=Sphaerotilus sp. TaxID=2093942 RepID=UPI0025EE3704|nr:molybdate ABC transporter substrate-binding protein [Sphaerotilus sp.]